MIDNYGDAGIAWRLAHGLSDTYGFDVRLFIDDVTPLDLLAPHEPGDVMICDIVKFVRVEPVDLVIEVLGAEIPESYVRIQADRTRTGVRPATVWVRYEYLTAEDWIAGIHLKPSLHPQYPEIKRYFFCPGFKSGTGGLLFNPSVTLEGHASPRQGKDQRAALLFSYGHPELKAVYDYLRAQDVRVDLPPGAAADQAGLTPTVVWRPQDELDRAFMSYDYVFVRGEDTITQVVAAGTPAIWQIYVQNDNAHHVKLDAFLDWYLDGLDGPAADATRALVAAWNFGDRPVVPALAAWLSYLPTLRAQAQKKAKEVRARGPALQNLVDFYRTIS